MPRGVSRGHVVGTDAHPRELVFPHGSSGVVPLTPTIQHSNVNDGTPPGGPCCSGAGHHGCGCGCPGCWCRLLTHFKDESNRETYGGQGGGRRRQHHLDMTSPAGTNRSDGVSSPSSFNSSSPSATTSGSLNSGFGAPASLVRHRPAASAVIINDTRHTVLESDPDEDSPHPWHTFVESPISSSLDHMSLSTGDRSILSSQHESSLVHEQRSSASASQIIAQAGAVFDGLAFAPRFLRLTPE
ncbi:hypothetical protein AYL99_09839 [Fonsecaea erecta]|uniref:Uncharacterized protein n=1 Tax=Fonsecaea erecta TaxID=1367422 RepID=A0A178Z7F0_9EURO|nr:hypothetical protein AYL99_09839 [Fonsecaea erecta]OAP55687.1 hypothetical protein AYL99_09839 [Fonsecaea erecta]